MSKKSLLCRKILSALSCLTVLLALAVSPVEVRADEDPFVMMDIVVYYNDTEAGCYDYVVGEQLKITEPGTYTMTFDCATALQFDQKNAGVTGLNNLGSIYLIDDKVFNTVTPDSIVKSFDFTYDSIEIDGTEVELKNHDERSGLKTRGEIDTNGPVNAWDDCQLADGTYEISDDFSLNFVGFENPQVIKITFTITNMEFKETETKAEEKSTEETEEEKTTEEPAETSSEEATGESTEAVTEESTEAQSTAASEKSDNSTNSTLKIVLIVVIVIVLIAVIILVIKKLKK